MINIEACENFRNTTPQTMARETPRKRTESSAIQEGLYREVGRQKHVGKLWNCR